MLFSGGGPSSKPKKEEKKEKRSDKDDKYEVQEAVFTRWANSLFDDPITDLRETAELDFLQAFCKLITGKKIEPTGNKTDDVDAILTALATDDDDRLLQISVIDLCDGSLKPLLMMMSIFINLYWRRFAPNEMGEKNMKEALRDWCLDATKEHNDVCVNDFTSSWRDGMALNILITSYDPSMIDLPAVRMMRGDERLENGLNAAKKYFKVQKLITPKEFHSEFLDSKSVQCYLMTLYIAMSNHSTSQSSSSKKSSRSGERVEEVVQPQDTLIIPRDITEISPSTSIQSSTHSSAPSTSTNITVIHRPDDSLQQSTETISDPNVIEDISQSQSSTSSRKSSKSKEKEKDPKYIQKFKEYEGCLEKVLAWLLEAEETLKSMEPVNESDVEKVKKQFKDFEEFMLSLTGSKEKVGKVFNHGYFLTEQSSGEKSESVKKQLEIVNGRWEKVRDDAMQRQEALKVQLNKLQRKQLEQIEQWLNGVEQIIRSKSIMPSGVEECQQEITEHTALEEQIDKQQHHVKRISTYVAVVGEVGEDTSEAEEYMKVEGMLKEIGERWTAICEWSEKRARNLDGICDLLQDYNQRFTHLSAWLNARQEELVRLKSTHHLTSFEEVEEQKVLIQKMNEALQSEQNSFIELSTLSTELRHRYKSENQEFTELIGKQFDTVSQGWENIVMRLEDHSQRLSQSRFAKRPSRTFSTDSSTKEDSSKKGSFQKSVSFDEEGPSTIAGPHTEETQNLVEQFLEKSKTFENSLKPIGEFLKPLKTEEYVEHLRNSPNKHQIENDFKEKFGRLLAAKSEVDELDHLMSEVHKTSINSEELHTVNERMTEVMGMYGFIVSRFTEIMQVANNPELAKNEEARVKAKLTDLVERSTAVWNDIMKAPADDRGHRVDDFINQINEQIKKFSDFKARNQNTEKFRDQETKLIELQQKVRREKEREKQKEQQQAQEINVDAALRWVHTVTYELRSLKPMAGNRQQLKEIEQKLRDVSGKVKDQLEKIVDDEFVKGAEQVVLLIKDLKAETDNKITKIENALHKYVSAEEVVDKCELRLGDLKRSEASLQQIEKESRKLRDDFLHNLTQKAQVHKQIEELLREEAVPSTEVIDYWKEKLKKLDKQWNDLENELEEHITLVAREHRREFQLFIAQQETLTNQLREAIIASGDATDAEELSEHVDNLEVLLEKLTRGSAGEDPFAVYADVTDTFIQSEIERVNARRSDLIDSAKQRCAKLQKAVSKCEEFEKDLCNFNSWCTHMHHILNVRLSQDINALDVPHEYKKANETGSLLTQLNTEFGEYQHLLKELGDFIEESKDQWSSADRLSLQKTHAESQLQELKEKFDQFKKPIQFDKTLDNISQTLSEIEFSLDSLTGVKAENCEYGLMHLNQLSNQLQNAQEEVLKLESKKDALVMEGILDEDQTLKTSSKLEQVADKANDLSQRCESGITTLKESLDMLETYKSETSAASNLLNKAESNNDKSVIQPLLKDAQSSIKKAKELSVLLKNNGVKTDDQEIVQLNNKLSQLVKKHEIDLSADVEKEKKIKIEELLQTISESLSSLDEEKDPQKLKSWLPHIAKDLARANNYILHEEQPDRQASGRQLAALNDRFNILEKKARGSLEPKSESTPMPSEVEIPVISPSSSDTEVSNENFKAAVDEFYETEKAISQHLDFENYPVTIKEQWEDRLRTTYSFNKSNQQKREKLVQIGREWAEKGRMELSDQQVLEVLDEADALGSKNAAQIKVEEQHLQDFERLEMVVKECVHVNQDLINNVEDMDLTDSRVLLKTQRDLQNVYNDISTIVSLLDDFESKIPGREELINQQKLKLAKIQSLADKEDEKIREIINSQLSEIQEPVEKETLSVQKLVPPDGISVSSGAGLSLAMDVQETEGEDYESTGPQSSMNSSLRQVFIDLNTFEEFFDTEENLPYENLDKQENYLMVIDERLIEDVQILESKQMDMDVTEYKHTFDRIKNVKDNVENKKQSILTNKNTLEALLKLFKNTEDNVVELGVALQKPKEKQHSLDLEDWEAGQLKIENLVPSTAIQIQQCDNQLSIIEPYLSVPFLGKMKTRLNDMTKDFSKYREKVSSNRAALEDELADERYLVKHLNAFKEWCDLQESLIDAPVTFLDPQHIVNSLDQTNMRQAEVDEKVAAFRYLETLKDRFVALASVDSEVKHEIRRDLTHLGKRISDLQLEVTKRVKEILSVKDISDDFWSELSKINQWIEDNEVQLDNVAHAQLFKPMLINVTNIINEASDMKIQLDMLQRQVAEELLEVDAQTEVHHRSEKTVDEIAKRFDRTCEKARNILDKYTEKEPTPEVIISQLSEYQPTQSPRSEKRESTEYGTLTTRDGSVPLSTQHSGSNRGGSEFDHFYDALDKPLAEPEMHQEFIMPTFSQDEKQRFDKCIQIKGRLQEIERQGSTTVDLVNTTQIRQVLASIQNFIDELGVHKLEMNQILTKTEEPEISDKGIQCLHDLERILESCKKRKTELSEMLAQSKIWEQTRSEMELWLAEGNENLHLNENVNELDEFALDVELKNITVLANQLDHYKEQLSQLNAKSNRMIDTFRLDENHVLSQITSKINTQWTKFNEGLCIRRAVLEASLRSRNDIQTTLTQLDEWLDKQLTRLRSLHTDTENRQRLKDTSKRREWMGQEREIEAEISAHRQVIKSVRDMCKKLLAVLEADKERGVIQQKLDSVETKWRQINDFDEVVKNRLQYAQNECEKLTKDLSELLHWTDMQISTILHDQPVGGDLNTVQRQSDTVQVIEKDLDVKNREVHDCIQLSHSYLMQHDLRPALHRGSVLDSGKEMERSDAELEERRIGVQILADSEKLKSSYDALKQHLAAWRRVVATAHRNLQELDTAIAESLLAIGAIESDIEGMKLVEELRLEELKEARSDHSQLKKSVQEAGAKVDDVNDCTGQIAAQNIVLSPQMELQIHTVNTRYESLKKSIAIRGAALERAFTDFGPSSEHFLADSVKPPWQRAISAVNQMPYYIDHTTENTQWDHPNMVEIFEKLCTFNQVKFSAYRTAMKLRALQKHMCLDLIDLPSLDEALARFKHSRIDQKIPIEDVVMCLVPLFEKAHNRYPQLLRNVPLAVDLALNLLLNIYDPCRDGKLRAISFAIAMVVLCNASLESKYKFLFTLVTTDDTVDHKQLGLLFYDLIHITKLLGEAAVFGGSNIEPSVRSCFEFNKYPSKLTVDGYLNWLKKEPQSLVWLPVMHRLASSEFAKHQAKCNACKMFPIVGMRYRCLRCFNYDICQNCFFSQRTSKSHKLTHPMQEYCTPTNPKDDVRDFTLMVKNKMKRSRSKVGYLPVETVDEGLPLENDQIAPQNPATEVIHQRMQVIAQRLAKRQQENLNATNVSKALSLKEENRVVINENPSTKPRIHKSATEGAGMIRDGADVKSPSQLIKQVEQMHKEEMDQLLQKLQFENNELKEAIERKRRLGSTPNLDGGMRQSGPGEPRPLNKKSAQAGIYASAQTMPHAAHRAFSAATLGQSPPYQRIASQPALYSEDSRYRLHGRSISSLPRGYSEVEAFTADQRRLLDAKSMRIHEHQLEERSKALEEQNKQLQIQLDRLQRIVDKKHIDELLHHPIEIPQSSSEFGLKRPDFDPLMHGVSSTDEDEIPGGIEALKMRRNRMDTLMNTMNELNKAMETFVGSVVNENQTAEVEFFDEET